MPFKSIIKLKKYRKKYYNKNKLEINNYKKEYYYKNKLKINERCRKYNKKNKLKINQQRKKYRKKNAEKIKAYDKFRNIRDKDKRSKCRMRYYYKNKKIIIIKNSKYASKRRKKDLNFKLLINLRRRILLALKGKSKSDNTMNLLGVKNVEFVWAYLEKQFKPGMTRKNHGKWHIDHIIPCSSFDLTKPEEQAKCFHYTNLQPLWASENLSTGNRIS